ncbi:MAG: beta-ketoacyl-[acyl-carrier-protein] synthase family protein [Mariprofundaceae bacterium]|nr:beta-ketoacyl-[acyl-carrier-protein] synthase family protein [Mariprofundaceae bacterium]
MASNDLRGTLNTPALSGDMDGGHQDGYSRRIVVTGIGVISPIGYNKEQFWQCLVDGCSGVGRLEWEADNTMSSFVGGRAKDFQGQIGDFGVLDKMQKRSIGKALKLMNRETQMGVAAAGQALAESNLLTGETDRERVGVCFGAGNVSMLPEDFLAGIQACTDESAGYDFQRWGTDGLAEVAPLWLLKCLPNMPACYIAIFNDLRGPNNSITQREASANLALAEACNIISDGAADAMVVGGTGTTLQAFNLIHEWVDREIARGDSDPEKMCRPFDLQRQGAVLAEGAAAFVLESLDQAARRGAPIYGEVIGAGSSCVLDLNRTPHIDEALAHAMQAALAQAGLPPECIGHVHAHGLGTRRSDINEAQALRRVFGRHTDHLPVVAAKSYMGNSGAGSGAIELAASLLALKHGRLFRILNCEQLDPQCPIVPVRSAEVEPGTSFINISVAPHGQASCVIMRQAA